MTQPGSQNGSPGGDKPIKPEDVNDLHKLDDKDVSVESHHHSLGAGPTQASPGSHSHNGKDSKALSGYVSTQNPPTVIGTRGGNNALGNLLIVLDDLGIIVNGTTF